MRNLSSLPFALMLIASPVAAQSASGDLLAAISAADANADGIVTRAELLAGRAATFTRLDRNHDGVLADDDIPFFLRRSSLDQQFQALKAQFDANRDGKVARWEFTNGPTPLFDSTDTDHDNRVTPAELAAAKAKAGR